MQKSTRNWPRKTDVGVCAKVISTEVVVSNPTPGTLYTNVSGVATF